jgi:transposase-like protein
MAVKVTPQMIEEMNEAYLVAKTYAAVARQFEISPTTVRKYIISDYKSRASIVKQVLSAEKINQIEAFICPVEVLRSSTALELTDEEKEDMKTLWEVLLT